MTRIETPVPFDPSLIRVELRDDAGVPIKAFYVPKAEQGAPIDASKPEEEQPVERRPAA